MSNKNKHIIYLFIGFILVNILASKFYSRWDLTKDKRYTLSNTTQNILYRIDENIMIKVYLDGDFPLDFKRLQQETTQFLEELKATNSNIHYKFINPKGIEEKLIQEGLQPSRLTIEEKGTLTEKIIFPWAIIQYKNKRSLVPLLVNNPLHPEKQLQNSIENLEYSFSKGISQVLNKRTKTIAIIKGNGELEDLYLYDLLKELKNKYNLAPFTLSESENKPVKTLKDLEKYDLSIIAKPTKAFTETQKLILDQYIMNGGKTLWLIDNVTAEMDSLQQTGASLFTPRDLNLTDLLFSYGVRINYDLVQDLYSSKIAVATGNVGDQTAYNQFLWRYYPLVFPNEDHPITKNIAPVNLKFPSSIDTLKNTVAKTILLQSSALTRVSGLPDIVSLEALAEKPTPEAYTSKSKVLGVLLEGKFTSAYSHRTKTFKADFKDASLTTKMLVISDGDLIANQVVNGKPTRLDIDKWTGQHFGNKDFLLNSIDYLLDDTGLMRIRSKSLEIPLLNKEKVATQKGLWQFINIGLPILLLFVFGYIFAYYRKRKYS